MNSKLFPHSFVCLILICLSALFPSCSVKKRSYLKGYYVDWLSPKEKTSREYSVQPTKKNPVQLVSVIPNESPRLRVQKSYNTPVVDVLLASKDKVKPHSLYRIKMFPPDTCSDMIYLKNGTEFPADIVELTDDMVRYRRCDRPGKEIVTTKKEKVLMLKFANGKVESFNNDSNEWKDPPTHPLAILAFASALAFLLFFALGLFSIAFLFIAIVAVLTSGISAHVAKKQILANVGEYKGLRLLKATRVIVIIATIISIIIATSLKVIYHTFKL